MRLLRNRRGQIAFEVQVGTALVKFIRIGSNGPMFDNSEKRAFYQEYNTLLDEHTEAENVLSLLTCAKRAYKHSADVCEFLWEYIMSKNFSEMTIQELISVYNKLCVAMNKKPRKAFSSRAEAISAIENLDALVKGPTTNQQRNEDKERIMTTKIDENGNPVEVAEKKPRGKGIGARAMELILEGKTNDEVIATIKAEIPDAHPTPATMAWYRNKLRKDGKLPPSARTLNKSAEATAPEAEEEAEEEAA